MKSIFKYSLHVNYDGFGARWEERQVIEMPCDAKILSVGIQAGKPMLWALVTPDAPAEKRTVCITKTGGELGDEFGGRRFIGTLLFGEGGIVLHVWE
jgi:hypothetical protein